MDIHNAKHGSGSNNNNTPVYTNDEEAMLQMLFLTTCEQWAKYVSLPFELVHATIPVINESFASVGQHNQYGHHHHQQLHEDRQPLSPIAAAAMAYWIAIVEGGTWTVEQILTCSLLQPTEASRQPNKKRQSSRSKRRNKEVLEERTTSDLFTQAQEEALNRGMVACRTALFVRWVYSRGNAARNVQNRPSRHRRNLAQDCRP